MSRTDWLAISGPTASGKTALALALARHWPIEIISIDSALVYRQMDIGTAKPTPAEQAAVPHHLIDLIDPVHSYSAAEAVRDARLALHAIRARGRLPVLVGGTMLYFKALFEGLDDLPASDPACRSAIEAEAQARGWPALHAELQRIDPVTAARLPPQDAQRIGRALEVHRISGRPLSAFHTRQAVTGPWQIDGLQGRMLSLEPHERSWLHQRIEQRFADMLQQGLIEEVQGLRRRGDLHPDLPSMRCVGYRQTWEWLDTGVDAQAPSPRERDRLQALGAAATRQLAKRQLTWLRGMPQREVLACDQPGALAQGLQWCLSALQGPASA